MKPTFCKKKVASVRIQIPETSEYRTLYHYSDGKPTYTGSNHLNNGVIVLFRSWQENGPFNDRNIQIPDLSGI